jgi:hypothetical protein
VSYDDVRQKQRLAFRGVLIDTEKQRLKGAHPSPVFSTLLDAVQEQTGPFKEFFQNKLQKYQINDTRAGGFLDASDFDVLFAPLPSIPESLSETEKHARRLANEDIMRQKRKKLAEVFLPFLQRELIRQFVVQTLAANLNADPVLTEALLTETSLLSDPRQPGRPLLDAFAGTGERGVSVSFFASPDGTGTALGTKTAGTADTSGKPGEANSARFEGYFEVPAAGAYRFFMVFGKKDAEAELHLITMPDTVMLHKATRDNYEVSDPGDFVELKPGVPYHFVFNARNLGGGDVALLIQGENLPKDSLARLTLYPHVAIERVQYAQTLLAKVLQLILGFEISEREIRYLLTHAANFANLNLSKLPVDAIDDATVLLQQFLRLANYALLKREIASGTDDLISIFETKNPDVVYKRIADLTRRDVKTVQEATKAIALPLTDFPNEQGLQRLWKGLQLIEKLGVPAESIARWAHIVKIPKTPNDEKERIEIARDVKNTVKARYEPEDWQHIAQPIFDSLRQRQRDALVAYILHRHGFERMEQLFEYFLIDPGMEPVVQTSRIRLAIASVQIFIQRCLLNLEPKVHPSVINSKQWQWMKRYRVWEANRKIFLFPENWLEPEFRDDKTHLFQELEGALLQGDVSNDLAEDAFFQYLKKLKELAKLDIVTMYCEEKPDPALNTLHVIGRTANTHKYFYRRYAHQMWTSWEPVTAEIDGDHIVAVVWRERLHLFWLTFLEKAEPNATAVDSIDDNATVAKIAKGVSKAAPVKTVEVQLNWSEYFQGEWTTRESSGFGDPIRKSVGSSFNSSAVFVYVYKEYVGGEERAVRINLTGTINGAFRVVSKNSSPKPDPNSNVYLLELPYPNAYRQAIRYAGSNALKVTFVERIETEEGNPPKPTQATKEILGQVNDFSLVTCNDVLAFDVEALIKSFPSKQIGTTPYELALAERRAKAAKDYLMTRVGIDASRLVAVPLSAWDQLFQWIINVAPIRALPNPFFYQDNLYTFFVEPSLTETTIDRWEEWIITTPPPVFELDDDWWKSLPIVPVVPLPKQPIPMPPIDPRARFGIQPQGDWLTNPATVLQFSDSVIGQVGGLNPQVVVTTSIAASGLGVSNNISPGGMVTPGSVSTIPGISGAAIGSVAPGSVHVVGGSGLSPALIGNIRALIGPNLGQNVSGIESVSSMLNRSIERKA